MGKRRWNRSEEEENDEDDDFSFIEDESEEEEYENTESDEDEPKESHVKEEIFKVETLLTTNDVFRHPNQESIKRKQSVLLHQTLLKHFQIWKYLLGTKKYSIQRHRSDIYVGFKV